MFSSRSQVSASPFSQIAGYKQQTEISSVISREFVICLLETNLFTSLQINKEFRLSAFNINTGEVFISQFFDSTNYNQSISVLHRFDPKYVFTSESCQYSVFFTGLKVLHNISIDSKNSLKHSSMYFRINTFKIKFTRTSFKLSSIDIKKVYNDVLSEVKTLPKSKLSILYNCMCGLLNFIKTQFQYQMNLMAANITLLELQDVLIYNPNSILALHILNIKDDSSLESLIKPITSTGQRLLRATLIQPLNQIELIQMRQNYLFQLSKIAQQDKKFCSNVRDLLKRFKCLDQVTLQLSQVHVFKKSFDERCTQAQFLIDQVLKIIDIIKNLNNIHDFILNHDEQNKFVLDSSELLQSEDPKGIWLIIDQVCEESILSNLCQQSEDQNEKMIFVIKCGDNQLLRLARNQYTNLKLQLRTLLSDYQKILQIENLKYKVVQKAKSLIFGNMLVVPKQFSDIQLRQKLTQDNDAIHIIENKGKFYYIITERLVSINLKIQQSVEEVMNQTSLQIFSLYQNVQQPFLNQIQQYSGWIFKVNDLIAQLDFTLAMTEYTEKFQVKCFPEFSDGPLVIQNGQDPLLTKTIERSNFSLEINSEHRLHLIYDPKDTSEAYLMRLGQYIILSQIGCMVPCLSFKINCFASIMTKFKSQVRQNLCENESSFTQEVGQLNFIYNQIKQTQRCTLIICDQMIVSSAHEENIALNIAYFERVNQLINQKDITFICATNQTDNLLIFQIQENINYLVSDKNSIKSIKGTELEGIIKDENNEQFNKDFIETITNDIKIPSELCKMLAVQLQQQEDCKRKKRQLIQTSQENLLLLD